MHKAQNLQSGHQDEDGHHDDGSTPLSMVAPVLERADAERITWFVFHAETLLQSKAAKIRHELGDDNETAKSYEEQAREASALGRKFLHAVALQDRISAVVDECAGFE